MASERPEIFIALQQAGDGDVVPLSIEITRQEHRVYDDVESAIKKESRKVITYWGSIVVMAYVSTTLVFDGLNEIATGIAEKNSLRVLNGALEIAGGLSVTYAAKEFGHKAMLHNSIVRRLEGEGPIQDAGSKFGDDDEPLSPIGTI
ncbi:MAG: hypothetical protein AAB546_03190 [Patescibacteria group bacterium]